MQICALLTRIQCKVSDAQVTVKACGPLVRMNPRELYWTFKYGGLEVTLIKYTLKSFMIYYILYFFSILALNIIKISIFQVFQNISNKMHY